MSKVRRKNKDPSSRMGVGCTSRVWSERTCSASTRLVYLPPHGGPPVQVRPVAGRLFPANQPLTSPKPTTTPASPPRSLFAVLPSSWSIDFAKLPTLSCLPVGSHHLRLLRDGGTSRPLARQSFILCPVSLFKNNDTSMFSVTRPPYTCWPCNSSAFSIKVYFLLGMWQLAERSPPLFFFSFFLFLRCVPAVALQRQHGLPPWKPAVCVHAGREPARRQQEVGLYQMDSERR